MVHIALEIINLIALISLGSGFFWKDRRCHLLRLVGWIGLGIYWIAKAPGYYGADDWINGLGATLALPIFLFLAHHEWRSYDWDEDYAPLRFVAGATFIAGIGYFIIAHVPIVPQVLIDVVAHHSVGLANLFGYNFGVGEVTPTGAQLIGVPITIILECTAIQAIIVAGAFLFGCRGDKKKRFKTFLVFLPVIYVVNLIRNALVIILVAQNGTDYFDFAHNVIGKGLSLATLIILILIAFRVVPELYEDINGLFELPWRKKPGHDYLQHVGRLYEKDEDDKTDEGNTKNGGTVNEEE